MLLLVKQIQGSGEFSKTLVLNVDYPNKERVGNFNENLINHISIHCDRTKEDMDASITRLGS